MSVYLLALLVLLLLSSESMAESEVKDLQALASKNDDTRVRPRGRHSFSLPVANMPMMQRLDFSVGNSFFRNPWVAAPASTGARDGLGPLFNTNACQNCHIKDGRGHAPDKQLKHSVSMLLRLSVADPGQLKPWQANHADPIYGGQLQDFSVPGIKPEAAADISYRYSKHTLAGGEVVELRHPSIQLKQFADGPIAENSRFSARVAPAMIGLGLLEAIDESRLQALADPADKDGDGISGRLNHVWDVQKQAIVFGRFGWKAGQPNLLQQNAAAFNGDMGLTSSLFPTENCTPKQHACVTLARKTKTAEPEVSDTILASVTFYSRNLAVPRRRQPKADSIQQGQRLFSVLGCVACHTPEHTTGANYPISWLRNRRIAPYTDLLLHDMGEGLADDAIEFSASGQEWRTPPLWGLGLTKMIDPRAGYLHDGRARNITEAILFHGGEAGAAQQAFKKLVKTERDHLLNFLQDL